MFGNDYILKIAEASQIEIGAGLFLYLSFKIEQTDAEEFACNIAGGVANLLLGKPAASADLEEFRKQNEDRIGVEAWKLTSDSQIPILLSYAAYNIGYGCYLKAGGGRLMNHYLAFFKRDSQNLKPDTDKLNGLSTSILEMVWRLKMLHLWHPVGTNPNELEFYKAINVFWKQQKSKVK